MQDIDIAKSIKTIDILKADLVGETAELFKSFLKGDIESIEDKLVLIIINCFLLGKRVGINFGRIEKKVYNKTVAMQNSGQQDEFRKSDLRALKDYLEMKR